MDLTVSGSLSTVRRTLLANALASAKAKAATPALEAFRDKVHLGDGAHGYWFLDGDWHLKHRKGDPERLGRLAEEAERDRGDSSVKEVVHKRTSLGDRGVMIAGGKDADSTDLLTVPLEDVKGIEDPILRAPGAENYFRQAYLHAYPRFVKTQGVNQDQQDHGMVGMAINSQNKRTQDRLHIHTDYIDKKLAGELRKDLESGRFANGEWADLKPIHGNHKYRARWVQADELNFNPIKMVYDQLVKEHGEAYARTHMGQHSIMVVPQTDAQGRKGFLIVEGRDGTDWRHPNGPHNSGSAEEWLINR